MEIKGQLCKQKEIKYIIPVVSKTLLSVVIFENEGAN